MGVYIYSTHKRIIKKLKKLRYEINDGLDGEKEDESKPIKTMDDT